MPMWCRVVLVLVYLFGMFGFLIGVDADSIWGFLGALLWPFVLVTVAVANAVSRDVPVRVDPYTSAMEKINNASKR